MSDFLIYFAGVFNVLCYEVVNDDLGEIEFFSFITYPKYSVLSLPSANPNICLDKTSSNDDYLELMPCNKSARLWGMNFLHDNTSLISNNISMCGNVIDVAPISKDANLCNANEVLTSKPKRLVSDDGSLQHLQEILDNCQSLSVSTHPSESTLHNRTMTSIPNNVASDKPRDVILKDTLVDISSNHLLNFLCEICGSRFTQKAYLLRHLKRNCSIANKVQCFQCLKYVLPKSLNKHRKMCEEKSCCNVAKKCFVCDGCSKKFRHISLLRRHIKICALSSRKCQLCFKRFVTYVDYNNHLLTEHKMSTAKIQVKYFINISEFFMFKQNLEQKTRCSYVQRCGKKKIYRFCSNILSLIEQVNIKVKWKNVRGRCVILDILKLYRFVLLL